MPLSVSICMLAMAHGSNEINVSAPLTAELFMLSPSKTTFDTREQELSIAIALFAVVMGAISLGVRYLDKFRSKFMRVSLSNGCIANTCASLCLFLSSFLGFTVSCTYILSPCLLMLTKMDRHKKIRPLLAAKAVIFAVGITFMSMLLTVCVAYSLLWLDYEGPYNSLNPYYNYNVTNA